MIIFPLYFSADLQHCHVTMLCCRNAFEVLWFIMYFRISRIISVNTMHCNVIYQKLVTEQIYNGFYWASFLSSQ